MSDARQILDKPTIRRLSERSDVKGAWTVLHAYGVIAAAMALFIIWPNPFSFFAAVIIIGSRQLGLSILMHDAAHGILFKNRAVNEWVGNWLLSYPVGIDLKAYRSYHLQHHKYTQQDEDPDIGLSAPFPITRASFARKVFRDLTGQTAVKQRAAQVIGLLKQSKAKAGDHAFDVPSLTRPLLVNALMLAGFTVAGLWWAYFALWLLPLFTWFQLVLRIRNIAEHAMVPDDKDPLRHARTTHANLLERALVAPYWVNYHVEHHVHMYVPCYNLPALHRAWAKAGVRENMEYQPGYASVLKLATSG